MSRSQFVALSTSVAILFGTVATAAAWTGPTSAPPNGNVSAPFNLGSTFQEKAGGVWFDGGIGINSGSALCIGTSCITSWGTFPSNTTITNVSSMTASQYCIAGGSCITNWPSGNSGTITGSGTSPDVPVFTSATALGNSSLSSNAQSSTENGNLIVSGTASVSGADSNGYSIAATNGIWTNKNIMANGSIASNLGLYVTGIDPTLAPDGNSYGVVLSNSVYAGGVITTAKGIVSNANVTVPFGGVTVTGSDSSGYGIDAATNGYIAGNTFTSASSGIHGTLSVNGPPVSGVSLTVSSGGIWANGNISGTNNISASGALSSGKTLSVYGGADISGADSANKTLWVGGVAYANDFCTNNGSACLTNFSDARLKKNIQPLEESLSKIEQLNPVAFQWINPSEHGGVTNAEGFIAQDLGQIFPDALVKLPAQGADKSLVGSDGEAYAITIPIDFDAYVVGAIQDIAHISGDFQTNLIAWLGNANNGIHDLYTGAVHSQEDDTQELCVGSTCIDQQQLAALLANEAASGQGSGDASSTP